MIQSRRYLPAILLAAVAVVILLLSTRTEPVAAPDQISLSSEYFFRDAEMTLAGDDGRAALVIAAGMATRELESTALQLDKVFIQRGKPGAWSLVADSARLPHEGADITVQGNLRLTFGPSGEWAATAGRALVKENGLPVTLTGDVEIHRPDGGAGGWALSGEHVVLEPESMAIRADQPVRLRIGEIQFEANGFSARIGEQVSKLGSDVKSTIDP